MKRLLLLSPALAWALLSFSLPGQEKSPASGGPYYGWQHRGEITLLTTPEGANLPASASVENFPVLVRLRKDNFDFQQARPKGEDIRFSSLTGTPLAFQTEEWDAAKGQAIIWVSIPKIEGNARQTIRIHWGKPDAVSESNAKAVFQDSNGYLSVWHMHEVIQDEAGTLESKDVGTTPAQGVIGAARHFAGKQGIFGGEKITTYPSADHAHSTEAWFRAEKSNATIIGWGNEGGGRGTKVRMQLRSPPHLHIDSAFADVDAAKSLPLGEWIHVVHTYGNGEGKIYLNGQLEGQDKPKLDIKNPARLWIGGWYHNYDFVGDIDEVRISNVARSADWVRLQYENQKPLQTLAGTIIPPGSDFTLSSESLTLLEGGSATLTAKAGGAQKVYWILKQDGRESVVATDQWSYTFAAGRVTGDQSAVLQFKAIYPQGVKTKEVAITVKEHLADPVFTLKAPANWNGRDTVEVVPQVSNLSALQAAGAGELKTEWSVSDIAVIKEVTPQKLILHRAQNSGAMTVTATMSNGGQTVTQQVVVAVKESAQDPWVLRQPGKDEKPEDGQFYARDDKGEGTLYYNGTLAEAAGTVFLRVHADDKPYKTEVVKPVADRSYGFAIRLKPGLIKYRVEFGTKNGAQETVLHTVNDIVCGDAYLIDGQSNALATDTREESPAETHEWVRSYGRPPAKADAAPGNLWCKPVWKARKGEKAELGWWGMELAKQLVESQKIPIFIINGAVGGTRIDQHQRSVADPADLSTIYGRMLWRVQQARLTHGIRGILWHQGENDQGSDGPTGGYGWETYQPLFVEMAAGWKKDFPNVQRYYVFQIWPSACGMGGKNGSGDRLREKQRTLPQLFSRMSLMSTLGIRPPGGCHYPLEGWTQFARLIHPLIERDFYGKVPKTSITPPNLRKVSFGDTANDRILLEFDQPVVWGDALADQFYLDGEKDKVESGTVSGNVLTLKLKEASTAQTITYLKEASWSQDLLLTGVNGLAALTFCEVPIVQGKSKR